MAPHGGMEEFARILDNFYTALFERKQPQQNVRRSNVIVVKETMGTETDTGSPFIDVVPTARFYEDLNSSGSDADADGSIYGFDGASATRISYGDGVLDETKLVLVFRLRLDFASGAPPGTPTLFRWFLDATHFITVDFTGGAWRVRRANGTIDSQTASDTFSSGDKRTITVVLTATQIGIAIDDGDVSFGGSTNIPTITKRDFDIGSDGSGNEITAGLFWMFIGLDVITNAEIDIVHAHGDTDPEWNTDVILDVASLDLSFLWHCTGVSHEVMSNRFGETVYES